MNVVNFAAEGFDDLLGNDFAKSCDKTDCHTIVIHRHTIVIHCFKNWNIIFLCQDFDGVGSEFEMPAGGLVESSDDSAQGETLCV